MAHATNAFTDTREGETNTHVRQASWEMCRDAARLCETVSEFVESGSLAAAQKQTTSKEIVLWMIPSEAPKALQASEFSELINPMRASCRIPAQH